MLEEHSQIDIDVVCQHTLVAPAGEGDPITRPPETPEPLRRISVERNPDESADQLQNTDTTYRPDSGTTNDSGSLSDPWTVHPPTLMSGAFLNDPPSPNPSVVAVLVRTSEELNVHATPLNTGAVSRCHCCNERMSLA